MDSIIDKLLKPEIVWVLIPISAIILFGLSSVIRALRGVPEQHDDVEQWKTEVQQLRQRVDALERAQRPPR
jgi:hypothetical protein